MATAFVLGGTGLIGRAVSHRFAERGWQVTVASRGRVPLPSSLLEAPIRFVQVDRRRGDEELLRALGAGVDAFVDVIALRPDDAKQLLRVSSRVGTLVVISTADVYADHEGRPATAEGPPLEPLAEYHPTVAPDCGSYRGIKAMIERALLDRSAAPVTVVRPGAVYGAGDTAVAREWYFVKRVLDRRPYVVFADRGASVLHHTAVENLAELVVRAAESPTTRVLNSGDDVVLPVLEIGRTIAEAMGHRWVEVLLPAQHDGSLGVTPWSAPRNIVLDITAARRELGYWDVTSYREAVPEVCRWMVSVTSGREWREVMPRAANLFGPGSFDYEAEARFLAGLG